MNDMVKIMRIQAIDRDKIFSEDLSNKGLHFEIFREHLKLNNKKTQDLIKKWAKHLNWNLTKNMHSSNQLTNPAVPTHVLSILFYSLYIVFI